MVEHAVMLQPYRRGRTAPVVRKINTPYQTGERVGHKNRPRTYQTASVEGANGRRKRKDKLWVNCLAWLPATQVDSMQTRCVRRISVRSAKVEHIRFRLHHAHRRMIEGKQEQRFDLFPWFCWRGIPQLSGLQRRDQKGVIRTNGKVLEKISLRKGRDSCQFCLLGGCCHGPSGVQLGWASVC